MFTHHVSFSSPVWGWLDTYHRYISIYIGYIVDIFVLKYWIFSIIQFLWSFLFFNVTHWARCNSSCSLDRSTLYGAICNATLWTTGALQFFWIGLKHRSTRASHVTKMDGKMAREAEVPFTLSLFHLIIRLL